MTKRFFLCVAIILLMGGLTACGGDVRQWDRSQTLFELYESKDLWLSAGIENYSVNYSTRPNFVSPEIQFIKISVSENEVAAYEPAIIGNSPVSEDRPFLADFRKFDEAFDWLEELINSSPYYLEIEYDETYGFPTYILIQSGPASQVSDSSSEILYTNFEVL
jgi:hypothetical protein